MTKKLCYTFKNNTFTKKNPTKKYSLNHNIDHEILNNNIDTNLIDEEGCLVTNENNKASPRPTIRIRYMYLPLLSSSSFPQLES